MQEIWKDVIGYEGLYKVSNLGNVISINYNGTKKSKLLAYHLNYKGYARVHLTKNKQDKYMSVHRLVAEAFIPNIKKYPQVNHKNGIKVDNRVDNLEWCTNEYNFQHALNTGLIKKKAKGYHQPYSKSVNQYDLSGNFIKHWDYISDASKQLNISLTSIYNNCNNKVKKPKYYIWRYADE